MWAFVDGLLGLDTLHPEEFLRDVWRWSWRFEHGASSGQITFVKGSWLNNLEIILLALDIDLERALEVMNIYLRTNVWFVSWGNLRILTGFHGWVIDDLFSCFEMSHCWSMRSRVEVHASLLDSGNCWWHVAIWRLGDHYMFMLQIQRCFILFNLKNCRNCCRSCISINWAFMQCWGMLRCLAWAFILRHLKDNIIVFVWLRLC